MRRVARGHPSLENLYCNAAYSSLIEIKGSAGDIPAVNKRRRAWARPPVNLVRSSSPVAQHFVVTGAAAAGAVVLVSRLGRVGSFGVDLATC
jgi:hypothetical protein